MEIEEAGLAEGGLKITKNLFQSSVGCFFHQTVGDIFQTIEHRQTNQSLVDIQLDCVSVRG